MFLIKRAHCEENETCFLFKGVSYLRVLTVKHRARTWELRPRKGNLATVERWNREQGTKSRTRRKVVENWEPGTCSKCWESRNRKLTIIIAGFRGHLRKVNSAFQQEVCVCDQAGPLLEISSWEGGASSNLQTGRRGFWVWLFTIAQNCSYARLCR